MLSTSNTESKQLFTSASFRDLSRVPRTVTRAYSHEFLTKELPRIASDQSSEAVLREQLSAYTDITGRPSPQGLRVALGKRGSRGFSEFLGIEPRIYDAHLKWLGQYGLTAIGRTLKAHEGNSFSSNLFPFQNDAEWEEYVSTTWHRFEVKTVAIVNYPMLYRTEQRLMFASYFAGDEKDVASRFEFDIVSIPFAIVWLMRFGLIDETTMRHWLFMLQGLTPAKLFLIRELIGQQRYSAKFISKRTGLSKRNLENHIFQIAEGLNEKVPRDTDQTGYGSTLVDIANNYGFLSFTGRPCFEFTPVATAG